MKIADNFIAFILTHGRPENVVTYKALRKHGYTGKTILIVDNEDDSLSAYKALYGDEVYCFDKKRQAEKTENADNFNDRRVIVYARNACYEIAKKLNCDYFIQLDDDYNQFAYRHTGEGVYLHKLVVNLDKVFEMMVRFLQTTPAKTIAMAQGGDFIGGKNGGFAQALTLKRKAMNTFFCETARPIDFVGGLMKM